MHAWCAWYRNVLPLLVLEVHGTLGVPVNTAEQAVGVRIALGVGATVMTDRRL